jgi:hypothetical protein
MKLVCTVTDVSAVVHAGGSPESASAIIEIPDEELPQIVKYYLANVRSVKENPKSGTNYSQLSFSILQE